MFIPLDSAGDSCLRAIPSLFFEKKIARGVTAHEVGKNESSLLLSPVTYATRFAWGHEKKSKFSLGLQGLKETGDNNVINVYKRVGSHAANLA